MDQDTYQALHNFTQRYVALWQQQRGHAPASSELYGVASPCIVNTLEDEVRWLPQPVTPAASLHKVEDALEIGLQPAIHAFYCQQYAGDMQAKWQDISLTLLQVWSADDFIRVQENLIGHLVTQKRLKLSPTLFLATTDADLTMISLCNLTGNVLLEEFGSKKRRVLADSLISFLDELLPNLPE